MKPDIQKALRQQTQTRTKPAAPIARQIDKAPEKPAEAGKPNSAGSGKGKKE